jgi:hypothetical protein
VSRRLVLPLVAGLLLAAPAGARAAKHATPGAKRAAPAVTVGVATAAADPSQAAASAYEAGRFADAQAGWERLIAEHGRTAALCYNLGNACFRLGHRGLAIVWYERARRLAPRDEDTRYNLMVARSALQDEEAGGWETTDRILTPNELAWLLAALVWAVGSGCGWALWAGWDWPRWRRVVLWGLPALLLVGAWLGFRLQDLTSPWAVTVQPTIEVRSGPGDQFAVGFTVPEGTRTLILNRRPGWIELGVPAKSLKGWAPEDAVERI